MKNRFCFAAVCAASLLLTVEAMGNDVSKIQPAGPPVPVAGNDRLSAYSHDNTITFIPQGNASKNVSKVEFLYFGDYAITSGQPWNGVTTSADNIDVKAGRSGSTEVADWFNNGLTSSNITGCNSGMPSELNFAIKGALNVYLNDGTVIGFPVRLGQGHGTYNYWWIGSNVFAPSSNGNGVVSTSVPVWASGTGGHTSDTDRLTCTYPNLRSDGDLVISDSSRAVWQAFPTQEYAYPYAKLFMQGDGNLVIYNYDGNGKRTNVLWQAGTGGGQYAGASCVFQSDGNLVIYTNRTPIYISATADGSTYTSTFYVSTDPINQ